MSALAAAKAPLVWLCALALGLGCTRKHEETLESAEFGIFYGGQIQERDELPFVVDESKQQQGFRLVLRRPAREPLAVHWELSRPGPAKGKDRLPSPSDRVTELGDGTLPPGERVFEKRFPFVAGDPLGLWNIRVTAGGELAIDRPFTVYDAAQRKRAKRKTQSTDAGR